MRIQSSHCHVDRGLDAYFTRLRPLAALLAIEHGRLPRRLWEPAAGDGAIAATRSGLPASMSSLLTLWITGGESIAPGIDYLTASLPSAVSGIVTTRPTGWQSRSRKRRLARCPIWRCCCGRTSPGKHRAVALLLFRAHPPARVWISSRRLPMMHRHGWTGRTAPSNTCFAWFIWDSRGRGARTFSAGSIGGRFRPVAERRAA